MGDFCATVLLTGQSGHWNRFACSDRGDRKEVCIKSSWVMGPRTKFAHAISWRACRNGFPLAASCKVAVRVVRRLRRIVCCHAARSRVSAVAGAAKVRKWRRLCSSRCRVISRLVARYDVAALLRFKSLKGASLPRCVAKRQCYCKHHYCPDGNQNDYRNYDDCALLIHVVQLALIFLKVCRIS